MKEIGFTFEFKPFDKNQWFLDLIINYQDDFWPIYNFEKIKPSSLSFETTPKFKKPHSFHISLFKPYEGLVPPTVSQTPALNPKRGIIAILDR